MRRLDPGSHSAAPRASTQARHAHARTHPFATPTVLTPVILALCPAVPYPTHPRYQGKGSGLHRLPAARAAFEEAVAAAAAVGSS